MYVYIPSCSDAAGSPPAGYICAYIYIHFYNNKTNNNTTTTTNNNHTTTNTSNNISVAAQMPLDLLQ